MSEIFNLNVCEISSLIQNKELKAEAVLSSYLENIKKHNGDINAIVSQVPSDQLLEQANKIDSMDFKEIKTKPLLGIPIAIKDLEDTKGIRTTYGSKIFEQNIPEKDGKIAERIRSSGAILIGKTNTPEFGVGSHTFNSIFGSTRNPYDKKLSAGGSSGGAASAIAANFIPIADGSDMMGSLRNPAAFNNIYGFRPTVGLVPSEQEDLNVSDRLSTSGPMAKTPRDLGYLLHVIAGSKWLGKISSDLKEKAKDIKSISCKEIRIGWIEDLINQYPFEDGILDLCKDCLNTVSFCGAKVSSVKSNLSSVELWESWTTLRSMSLKDSLSSKFNMREKKHFLKKEIIWEIQKANQIDDLQIQEAKHLQIKIKSTLDKLFLNYDYLALPSAAVFPFDVNFQYPQEINGRALDTYHRWMEVVILVSLLGLPCISLPCGLNEYGVPTGLQIFGKPYSDIEILSLAETYSNTTNADKIRPNLN